MPKRSRRLYTPKQKNKLKNISDDESKDGEVSSARGILKGVLKEVLETVAEDYDPTSLDENKYESNYVSKEDESSSEEENTKSPYVLKLFDRSLDLSQFEEDTPLYPICRAWIANQPKANYKKLFKQSSYKESEHKEGSVELPGPEGPPVSRIPNLLPKQIARNKESINLNYEESPPPSREHLMAMHLARWGAVRRAWSEQAAARESRYVATQSVLDAINVIVVKAWNELPESLISASSVNSFKNGLDNGGPIATERQ